MAVGTPKRINVTAAERQPNIVASLKSYTRPYSMSKPAGYRQAITPETDNCRALEAPGGIPNSSNHCKVTSHLGPACCDTRASRSARNQSERSPGRAVRNPVQTGMGLTWTSNWSRSKGTAKSVPLLM
jgi:hypothetical protein